MANYASPYTYLKSLGTPGTQPNLSVAGITDGQAYSVAAGSRSIAITIDPGALVSTQVKLASNGSTVPVSGSITTTPVWNMPADDAVQVKVTTQLAGFTSEVSWTEDSRFANLVKSSDPASVTLAPSSTSSSSLPKTFTAPTGGSGSFTLTTSILQSVGTGATLQGDNTTGYYLDNLQDADTVEVIGVFSDDVTGQEVENRFVVTVGEVTYTEPALSVTGRANGEAYTVSSGSRTIAISNPDAATLLTTVTLASDGSSLLVTGNGTTSPVWTAPAGGTLGESVQVLVTATKNGLTSSVSFTERVEGAPAAPTLSIADRVDGEAYSVSAGVRTISITAEAGATLNTSVELASDGSTITVTDPTTTTPEWTAPSGGTDGDAYQVLVTATKDGLTSSIAFTERMVGSPIPPSFADVSLELVDLTDGTWTLYDPDGLVNSVSFDPAKGQHTITMNALTGSSDYNYLGTVFRGPRWYKLLEIGSTTVTTDDWLSMTTLVNSTDSAADFVQRNVYGTTHDPTSTNPTNMLGLGASWSALNGTEMGVFSQTNHTIQANALHRSFWCTQIRGLGRIGMVASAGMNSSDIIVSGKQNQANLTVPASQNLYQYIAIGIKTNSTNITQGQQCSFRAEYSASTYTGI